MAYTIIGIDGKHYGPVGEEELRRWIAEGRLNGESQAQGEGDTEFHPLAAFPEFADALGQQAPLPTTPTPTPGTGPSAPPTPAELLAGDYDLAIDACVGGGWKIVKNNFWPSVGVSFLVVLIVVVLNRVFGLITQPTLDDMIYQNHFTARGIFLVAGVSILVAPIQIVILSGMYFYFLKLARGQNATLGDAFAGFGPAFGPLLLLGWVQALLVIAGTALCLLPGIYLSIAWSFAPLLVIDRQMGFWEAMELSRRMVSKHWFVVFGFVVLYILVALSGILGCCIGFFVTLPIGIAALVCAYESIFSRRQNR